MQLKYFVDSLNFTKLENLNKKHRRFSKHILKHIEGCLLVRQVSLSSIFVRMYYLALTGLVSSGASLTSWGEGASSTLVGHPSSDGVTIKMPYGVDVLH